MPARPQLTPEYDRSAQMPAPAGGVFVRGVHHFPARIYFEDTDVSGLVYHANYLRYMERARSDMLRVAGIDQRGTIDRGEGVYAVADLQIAYRRPAKLDDDIRVESRVTAIGGATVAMAQTIYRGTELLTEGKVTVAFLNHQGRPTRQPRHWVSIFTRLSQGEDLHS